MANAIQLQQTLHGYGDGHQLLASSLNLSRDQQWQLLVMSDLSGPSFRSGFDSYLTGYPIESGGYYCLARTWFAPELPRPGCVWTHTILISDTDVAQIADFGSILSHFRRPTSNEDLDSYTTPIIADSGKGFATSQDLDSNVARKLLSFLYGSPLHRVILISESSRTYEQLVIALLSQQWPRLRRSFRFCTGSLAIRDLNFDLAIAPPNVLRQGRDDDKTITAATTDLGGPSEQMVQEWIRVAAEDLSQADSQGELRRFLWRFGPDYAEGRSAFRPLSEVFLASSHPSESVVDQVLATTSHFFFDVHSSQRLKSELFGITGIFGQMSPQGESSVLLALVTHPAAVSIPADVAAIGQRANSLVGVDFESALRIATAAFNIGGSRAEQYLRGFAAGIKSRPNVLSSLPLSLMCDLFRRIPSLLESPEAWQGPIEYQLTIAANISSLNIAKEFGRNITKAVLSANAWTPLTSVLTWFGDDALSATLEWIDAIPEQSLSIPQPIFDALSAQRHRVTEVIGQTEFGSRALRFASAFLDPRAERVRALGEKWVKLAGSGIQLAPPAEELRSKGFALSLGLSVYRDGDVRLVREGFSAIYDAARDERLDEVTWSFIEPYLPWYVITWDRCVQLIRGVVRLFVENKWPVSEFLSTFLTAEQLQRALEEADRTRAGSRYIRRVCDSIESNSEPVDEVRSQIVKHYCE
jgi:hypothetical protein